MHNIAIIDDNLDLRKSLSEHFSRSSQIQCVMAVDTVEKFVKFHRDFLEIDLILLDIRLYDKSGIQGLPLIRQREPDAEIIMYTMVDEYEAIFQSICNGATGYLLKEQSPAQLEEEIVSVLEKKGALLSPAIAKRILRHFQREKPRFFTLGEEGLNDREKEVVVLLKDGASYESVAAKLNISIDGVRYHIKNIYRKLGVRKKSQLAEKLGAME